MFAHGAPARLAAIVDWEMSTIGDPLLDFAWILMTWPDPEERGGAASYVDYDGMPTRAELRRALRARDRTPGRPARLLHRARALQDGLRARGGLCALRLRRRRQPEDGRVRRRGARHGAPRRRARRELAPVSRSAAPEPARRALPRRDPPERRRPRARAARDGRRGAAPRSRHDQQHRRRRVDGRRGVSGSLPRRRARARVARDAAAALRRRCARPRSPTTSSPTT